MNPPTIKVLIVTDISESLERLKCMLADAPDIEAIGVSTAPETVVTLAREVRPDVVVMDYDMPGLDGAEATREILQDNPQIQVIMLSVVNEVDDIRRAMRAGARDYLIKPLADGELVETVRWLIRERREYTRLQSFVKQLRKAYRALFYDDKPVPDSVVAFLEAQVAESPGDRLALETLAVAYARNREWVKLAPLAEALAQLRGQDQSLVSQSG